VLQDVRLPSPLIEPDSRFSRIRLSDWLGGRLTTCARSAAHARAQHTKRAEHHVHADMPAARRQLATAGEEVAHVIIGEVAHVVIQMRLDHAVRGVVRAGTEVVTLSPHQAVQCIAHSLPRPHVARYQDRGHLVLQTLHTLLRSRT
jgi:hypothetical protein